MYIRQIYSTTWDTMWEGVLVIEHMMARQLSFYIFGKMLHKEEGLGKEIS